jgi:hypothetical protein
MLVQSGSGKVYAVLADNADFELAIMPVLQVISTTVVLALRCRYKARTDNHFNPMLVPKRVLAGGVDRSDNTLRSVAMFNTGFTVDKVGKSFPALMADKIETVALTHYLTYDQNETPAANNFIGPMDLRQDFCEDFSKLIEQAISPIYPAKDLSSVPQLTTTHDFVVAMDSAEDKHTKLHAVPAPASDDVMANVKKLTFPVPPVDNAD